MQEITELLKQWKSSFPQRAQETADILRDAGLSQEMIDKELKMVVKPPEPYPKGIPTLAAGVYRPPTPMISARFNFAGSIRDISDKWLSVSEMEKVINNRKVMRHIESHRKHWFGSAPAVFSDDRLSLLRLVVGEEENMTFLVWPEATGPEPEIWHYAGHHEAIYQNLKAFLVWIVSS